jgi:uncharacterized protein YgbK (DUF1537 family)
LENTQNINMADLVEQLPPEWQDEQLSNQLFELSRTLKRKIVVLDDDPTGVQTVHDVLVLTQWDKGLLTEAFHHDQHVFFILTNTRAMDSDETEKINREIAINVIEVAKAEGYDVQFVSRSDSTLRGHYPLETDILSEEMTKLSGQTIDGHLIIPAFFEAGRYTYGNIHYLKEEQGYKPVHLTEFAKDKVFGFTHSDLTEWVLEKTDNRYKQQEFTSISIEQIRNGGPEKVESILLEVKDNQPVIINAMSYRDLEVLSIALLWAEMKGKRFIYRTAASFVKAFSGISNKDYLSKEQMIMEENKHAGGLVVIGSHTQKTTRQLGELITGTSITPLELNVEKILSDGDRSGEIERLISELNSLLEEGRDSVLYSSRKLISVEGKKGNLNISQQVSESIAKIVESLTITPRFMIAKGGITSSDVATKGLKIRKAMVLGQVAPAVPVWLTDKNSKFPNICYIIFPGNVGDDHTLLEIVKKITN